MPTRRSTLQAVVWYADCYEWMVIALSLRESTV
jgi:hypothetical protein